MVVCLYHMGFNNMQETLDLTVYYEDDGQVNEASSDTTEREFYEAYIAIYKPFDCFGSIEEE